MKKTILIFVALIAFSATTFAQPTTLAYVTFLRDVNIGNIKIKSKVPLTYDSRTQLSDTIYITIKRWNYNPVDSKYTASVVDYVKAASKYKSINEKTKSFTKAEVDGLFTMLGNSILPTESYSDEMDNLLSQSLLIDTQTNLFDDGKTVYGGIPADWELITD